MLGTQTEVPVAVVVLWYLMLEGQTMGGRPSISHGTRLEEVPSRRFKGGDRSSSSLPCSHVGKRFVYLPSLFPLRLMFSLERGLLEQG